MSSLSTPKSLIFHRTTALAAVAISSLTMSACAFKTDGPPPDPQIAKLQQQVEANRPLQKTELSISYPSLPEPNQYMYEVKWPIKPGMQVKFFSGESLIEAFDAGSVQIFKTLCSKDTELNVEVHSLQTGIVNNFSLTMRCPVDYEVKGHQTMAHFPSGLNGRLFLRSNSSIQHNGNELLIKVEELRIDDLATVRIFSKDRSKPASPAQIKKAPAIKIIATKASGLLILDLNGINGSRGDDGADEQLAPGQAGTPGELGPGLCKEKGPKGSTTLVCTTACLVAPTNGTDGTSAIDQFGAKRKGNNGSDGRPGIGTSDVSLRIDQSDGFRLEVRSNPGMGGQGGKGGKITGGALGTAGVNPGDPCRNARSGTKGDDGTVGDNGDYGSNGGCGSIRANQPLLSKIRILDIASECSKVPGIVQALE